MRTLLGGLRPWFIQRVGALYLLLFLFVLSAKLALAPPGSFAAWHDWVASGPIRTGFYLFVTAFVLHAWVGLRDIILDYGKPRAFRIALLIVIAGALVSLGTWLLQTLFML